MANEQLIDTVVSDDASKQVSNLTKLLQDCDIELVKTAKDASALNAVLANNSKSFAQLNKAALAAALANEKLAQAQNKTATTSAQLGKAKQAEEAQIIRTQQAQDRATAAQERAAAAAQKALSPYQQLSKQLETMRANAKDIAVTFGEQSEQFKAAQKPVQDLDARLKGIDKTLGQSQRNVGNYADGFKGLISQFLPFGQQITKVGDSIKTVTESTEGGTEALAGLTSGFGAFAIGAFAVGIAAATYYLSQFQSAANTANVKIAGLKAGFAQFGREFLGLDDPNADSSIGKAAKQGETNEAAVIALTNQKQIKDIQNSGLAADAEYYRALSTDRNTDIEDRRKYLKQAQDIEKQIQNNQRQVALATIQAAYNVGFQGSTLTPQQISQQRSKLDVAAANGNVGPATNLANTGTQFTAAGLALYKQGVQEYTTYLQTSQNEIVKINADSNNLELRADRARAQAQNELDQSRIQSAKDVAQRTLQSTTASNTEKLAANNDYVTKSIDLINKQADAEELAAGLGSGRGGRDTQVEAITRQKIEQDRQNKIIQIQNEGLKTSQDLRKNALEAQLRLDKAQIEGVQDKDKLIIDDETQAYQKRIDANNDFIQESLKLVDKQTTAQLKAANLPANPANDDPTQAKTRASILQEATNQRNKILADGAKETVSIQKNLSEQLKTGLEEILKNDTDGADKAVVVLNDSLNKQLDLLENERNGQSAIADELYRNGKISEQKYRDDLLQIEDEYNVKRLSKQLATDKAILATRQAEYNNALADVNGNESAIPDTVKSALKTAVGNVKTDSANLSGAQNKQQNDNAGIAKQLTDGQKETIEIIGDVQQAQQDASKAIQDQYQHEIDLLQERKNLIEQTAKADIDRVNNSILSEKDKQNQINVINAQAQAQQAQIDAKEAQIKTKAAEAEKAQAIASILENTAVAIIKLVADSGLLGAAAIPIVAALGAAQLATVIAQPIPKFEKGGLTAGGGLIWGEKGMEMATLPSGERMFSPNGATYANMPKGTVITPHKELLRMIQPGSAMNMNRQEIGWQHVVAAIERNKQKEQKRPYVKVNVYSDRSGLRK